MIRFLLALALIYWAEHADGLVYRVKCLQEPPPAPKYGSMFLQKIRIRAPSVTYSYKGVTYRCEIGYKLIGTETMRCNGFWPLPPPICQLDVFDERNSYCDFSYKRKCIYVNEVNNTVGWIQETIISKHYLQQNNSEIALAPEDTLSPSAYEPPLVTNKTIRSKLLSVRLAEDRSEAGGNTSMHESLYFAKETLTRRKRSQTRSSASGCVNKICPSHTSQTKSTKKITSRRKSTVLAVRRAVSSETFEVGPFRRSAAAYVKFKFSASGGFAYCFYVVAHCLPDPPGHLDHVGSVTDPAVTYKLERHSSSGSHTVCLNLRDTVECEKFAIRFTAYVAHLSGDTARLTFTPKGVHRNPIVGNCPGGKADNERE